VHHGVDPTIDRQNARDVGFDELEPVEREEMRDVGTRARDEVVDADDVVPLRHEPLTEVAAEKAGTTGDENAPER
jgi:hypothetical protein